MGWLGKIIGGAVGYAIQGALGAILGAALGHKFDSKLNFKTNKKYLSLREQQQLTFFVAAFSMLAKLVQVDGKLSNEEIKSVEDFIIKDLKLSRNTRIIAVDIFNTALNSFETFEAFAYQFYENFNTKPQLLELMMDIMLRTSIADGHISKSEEKLLTSAARIFNFSESRYAQLKSKYSYNKFNIYYSILGCKEIDSNEHIKSCYRKLAQEYHPDKIISKGLPEEFIKFSQDKFQKIQEAWDYIKQQRKIK